MCQREVGNGSVAHSPMEVTRLHLADATVLATAAASEATDSMCEKPKSSKKLLTRGFATMLAGHSSTGRGPDALANTTSSDWLSHVADKFNSFDRSDGSVKALR